MSIGAHPGGFGPPRAPVSTAAAPGTVGHMATADDPLSLVRRRILAGLGEVNILRLLPAVAADLRAIRGFVGTVAREVTEMNASVGRIEPEVVEVGRRLDGLELRTVAIEEALALLRGHMEQLDETLHPLRRRRRTGRTSAAADAAAPPD